MMTQEERKANARPQPNTLLRDLRLKAGLSRSQLADKAGVSQAVVKNAELGNRIQDVKAYQIAQAISEITNTPYSFEDLHILTM